MSSGFDGFTITVMVFQLPLRMVSITDTSTFWFFFITSNTSLPYCSDPLTLLKLKECGFPIFTVMRCPSRYGSIFVHAAKKINEPVWNKNSSYFPELQSSVAERDARTRS